MVSFKYSEETIRSSLCQYMIQTLGYPRGLLVIEKEIAGLPHCKGEAKGRRADLICFAPNIHRDYPLYPLLLVECKAVLLDEAALQQLIGYNATVKAPFICLANHEERRTYWHGGSAPFLPRYSELVKHAQIP